MTSIALCGCGNMGSAIAGQLADADTDLVVTDLDRPLAQAVASAVDARVVDTVEALAAERTHVVLSLPDPEASVDVVDRLCGRLGEGATIIETSTIGPAQARALADSCREASVHFVDAAILAGVAAMEQGHATLLLGGDDDALAAAAPVLDRLSSRRLHMGGPGAGMAAKVANNAVSHSVMVILVEALAMARSAGVAPHDFVQLLSDPEAGLMRPLSHRIVERVLTGDFDGGMPTTAARKDSLLALQVAQDGGIPLFAIQAAHTPYEMAVQAGLGRDDYAAIATLWEQWTGETFRGGGT